MTLDPNNARDAWYMEVEGFNEPPCLHMRVHFDFVENKVVSSYSFCDDCGRILSAPYDWQQDGFLNPER